MNENPRYTDAQIDAEIARLRAGADPVEPEVLEHFTGDQLARYRDAIEHESLANESAIRRAWFEDPALRGLDAPFPMFEWSPVVPDTPEGL